MASRIAVSSLRAAARPRAVAPVLAHARTMASGSNPPPAERASELIEKLPQSNLVSKTGTVLLGTGLMAAAISQELYVLNEETVILAGSAILFTYIAKLVREPYSQWAQGQIDKVAGILNSSRAAHTQVVKDRITSVEQMKDVVSLTKSLFALSKETATLESDAFVQKQRVALAAELKTVLDSWVRFEQQQKESEQAELAQSVIDKVLASISDEKTQKDILIAAVAEIEQLVKAKAI